jgi:hypothetical protein
VSRSQSVIHLSFWKDNDSPHFRNCDSETAICNPIACKTSRCSTNVDCECLSFTSNPTIGVCAALLLSCTSVARCNSERTCPIENTICVNNTRCQYPVCYPLALADKQICPSSVTTMTRMKNLEV